MRIAMVSEHASPLAAIGGVDAGGQNVHVAELSAALGRRGHEVLVYTRRDDPSLPARVRCAPNVEVVHVDAGPARHVGKDELLPFMKPLAHGMAADWLSIPPDVVHGHFWMSGLAALEAAAMTLPAPPVLETFHALGSVKRRHQGAADTSPSARRSLEPRVARTVQRILATCPDEVGELEALGAARERISVAPCGVDVDLFRPTGPMEDTGGRRRIAAIGRLVPRKGFDLAIQALAALDPVAFGDVELHIVGGSADATALEHDEEATRLRRLAAELGVADRVIFRGQVAREKMPALLRSCRAVVCTPWYEPFGIVPLEAMACSVPVIAAAVGGLQDSVVHGSTGLHVAPRDVDQLVGAVQRLLLSPDEAGAMGRAGRLRAEQQYSWDHVAELSESAYAQVLGERMLVQGRTLS